MYQVFDDSAMVLFGEEPRAPAQDSSVYRFGVECADRKFFEPNHPVGFRRHPSNLGGAVVRLCEERSDVAIPLKELKVES